MKERLTDFHMYPTSLQIRSGCQEALIQKINFLLRKKLAFFQKDPQQGFCRNRSFPVTSKGDVKGKDRGKTDTSSVCLSTLVELRHSRRGGE